MRPAVLGPRPTARRVTRHRLAASSAGAGPTQQREGQRTQASSASGRVRNVTAAETGALLRDGWVLLDVRPVEEVSKVAIKGAVAVPLFAADPSNSFGSIIKKLTAFGMGGWWEGGTHMIPNEAFLSQVQAKVPKDAKVVVGCQKGLRSLAAAEQLSRAGYNQLGWIIGGFDTAKKEELPTVDGRDIRYGGIGGLSELLGWTQVQQESSAGLFGGVNNVLKVVAVLLVLDMALFGVEQLAYLAGVQLPF